MWRHRRRGSSVWFPVKLLFSLFSDFLKVCSLPKNLFWHELVSFGTCLRKIKPKECEEPAQASTQERHSDFSMLKSLDAVGGHFQHHLTDEWHVIVHKHSDQQSGRCCDESLSRIPENSNSVRIRRLWSAPWSSAAFPLTFDLPSSFCDLMSGWIKRLIFRNVWSRSQVTCLRSWRMISWSYLILFEPGVIPLRKPEHLWKKIPLASFVMPISSLTRLIWIGLTTMAKVYWRTDWKSRSSSPASVAMKKYCNMSDAQFLRTRFKTSWNRGCLQSGRRTKQRWLHRISFKIFRFRIEISLYCVFDCLKG